MTYRITATFRLKDGSETTVSQDFTYDPLDGFAPADQGGVYDRIDSGGLADVILWDEIITADITCDES